MTLGCFTGSVPRGSEGKLCNSDLHAGPRIAIDPDPAGAGGGENENGTLASSRHPPAQRPHRPLLRDRLFPVRHGRAVPGGGLGAWGALRRACHGGAPPWHRAGAHDPGREDCASKGEGSPQPGRRGRNPIELHGRWPRSRHGQSRSLSGGGRRPPRARVLPLSRWKHTSLRRNGRSPPSSRQRSRDGPHRGAVERASEHPLIPTLLLVPARPFRQGGASGALPEDLRGPWSRAPGRIVRREREP